MSSERAGLERVHEPLAHACEPTGEPGSHGVRVDAQPSGNLLRRQPIEAELHDIREGLLDLGRLAAHDLLDSPALELTAQARAWVGELVARRDPLDASGLAVVLREQAPRDHECVVLGRGLTSVLRERQHDLGNHVRRIDMCGQASAKELDDLRLELAQRFVVREPIWPRCHGPPSPRRPSRSSAIVRGETFFPSRTDRSRLSALAMASEDVAS